MGYLVGEPRARALSALRTAKALSTVLDHPHRGRGQLFDLVARRLTEGSALLCAEDVPAAATLGPVLDDLVHRPRRQQRATVALMAILGAPLPARGILTASRTRRSVRARRARGVARALPQLPLEPLHPRLELLDAAIHPQQDLDDDLPTSVIDRLRLGAVTPSLTLYLETERLRVRGRRRERHLLGPRAEFAELSDCGFVDRPVRGGDAARVDDGDRFALQRVGVE